MQSVTKNSKVRLLSHVVLLMDEPTDCASRLIYLLEDAVPMSWEQRPDLSRRTGRGS